MRQLKPETPKLLAMQKTSKTKLKVALRHIFTELHDTQEQEMLTAEGPFTGAKIPLVRKMPLCGKNSRRKNFR